MRIVACHGTAATALDGHAAHAIDLSLTGPQLPGTWVLTFLGAAREVLSEGEAERIRAAIGPLRLIVAGGVPGDAFADIEERGPQQPPNLAAAHVAGKTIA
jgi:hydrogenase expression/formation protein HypC